MEYRNKNIQLGVKGNRNEPYRVFIIDDSIQIRTVLKRILVRFGFHICGEAMDGEDAINTLGKMSEPPDIICIDQDMPVLNGTETIKILNKKYANVKIVMITAHSHKELVQEVIQLKIHGYLLKPIEPKKVLEKFAVILGRKELLEEDTAYKTQSIDLNKIIIPSLPEVVLKVASFDINDVDKGIRELEEIILPDTGTSSSILKLANSSYYGRSKKITNLRDAITLLGIKTVKNMILLDYNKKLNKNLKHKLFKKYLREHPVLSSLIAFDLVKPFKLDELQKNIFLIVLLRKIGMNIFALNFSEQYLKVLKLYEFNLKTIYEIEKDEFNTTSIELGKKIFKVWKMPDFFVEAVSNQNFNTSEITKVADFDRISRLSDILAKSMLGLELQKSEENLKAEIFDFYKISEETRELFGEEYYDTIREHPFMAILS